jgi:ribosomal protein S18 acetylase RimI-like enzyme
MNIVQPAEKTDESAIDRIMNSLSNFTATDRDCVRELWEDFINNGSLSSYQFCVCRDINTQSVVGFACFGKHALTENTFDLYWIAVDSATHRSGAGSDLLAHVEEQVLVQNGRRLIIETSSTEPYKAARKFYRHHQYLKEAVIRDFYAPGDHLVFYTKYLMPPTELDGQPTWTDRNADEQEIQFNRGQKDYPFPG